MARQAKKFFYIYKTTNLINDKFYIGMHSASNLKDGYLGSGTRLRRSIRKYGKENFKLEILEFLPDFDSLKKREQQLVNEDLLKEPMCMNLVYGGGGGFISPEGYKKGAKRMNEIVWSDAEFIKRKSESTIKNNKILWSNAEYKEKMIKILHESNTNRIFSDDHRKKLSLANSIHQSGCNNSQYGTRWNWITNGVETKKISREQPIADGWHIGRTI